MGRYAGCSSSLYAHSLPLYFSLSLSFYSIVFVVGNVVFFAFFYRNNMKIEMSSSSFFLFFYRILVINLYIFRCCLLLLLFFRCDGVSAKTTAQHQINWFMRIAAYRKHQFFFQFGWFFSRFLLVCFLLFPPFGTHRCRFDVC